MAKAHVERNAWNTHIQKEKKSLPNFCMVQQT